MSLWLINEQSIIITTQQTDQPMFGTIRFNGHLIIMVNNIEQLFNTD